MQIGLRAQLVHTLLQQGRGQQALEAVQQGLDLLDSLGGSGPHDLALRLAAIEALRAVGDRSGAITALRAALALLAARAAAIADPACRQSYCDNVVAHARLLALGRELLIRSPP